MPHRTQSNPVHWPHAGSSMIRIVASTRPTIKLGSGGRADEH
jgi:hypothetical protein